MGYVTILYHISYLFCVYVPLLCGENELNSIAAVFSLRLFTDSPANFLKKLIVINGVVLMLFVENRAEVNNFQNINNPASTLSFNIMV